MDKEYHSVVRYRVGGKDYPMYTDRRCKVCNHPNRDWIEQQINYGYGWTAITKKLDDPNLSIRNVSNHYSAGHMPLPLSTRRKIIEDRAAATNKDSTGMVGPVADPWSISQVGMQVAFERLQNGEIEPDVKDLIAFAKLNIDLESRLNQNNEITAAHIIQLLQAAKAHMSPEEFAGYLEDIEDNPAMQQKELPVAQSDTIEVDYQEERYDE